jgi:2-haloacid dehalogenase
VAIDTIVFDLGGVLVDWNPRYLYRKLIPDEREMETFLRDVCTQEWNEKHDAGQPFAKGTSELIAQFPEKESLIRAYFDRWPEMLGGSIAGTVYILEQLRKNGAYRLLALSNWSSETFPLAVGKFPFLNYFEAVLLSGKEKLIKPDPQFFKLLSSRYNVEPERALFIDDVQKNVDAANRLGFRTIRFQNPQQLERDLIGHGISLT